MRSLRNIVLVSIILFVHSLNYGQNGKVLNLSLQEARDIAKARSYQIQIANSAVKQARGRNLESWSAFLPSVSLSENYIKSNNPVTVFSLKLKQGIFTQQDFDLAALNTPDALDNFTTTFQVQQPLFNLDAVYGKSAAGLAVKATKESAKRAEEAVLLHLSKSYYRLILARENLRAVNEAVEVNKTALERISEIVKSLKKFARLDEAEVVKANLKECVETSLALLNHELKDRIKVVKELVEIPEINCHASDMNQVLMSLLHNAIEAMEGEGEIKISTGKNKDHVWVKICDTGCGISHDYIDKIFDPGFTTKGVGVGTGMGLAIAYQIVKSHKGRIHVESELGKGSTFTVEIPTNGVF